MEHWRLDARLVHAILITILICTSNAALAQSDDPNALQRRVGELLQAGRHNEAVEVGQHYVAAASARYGEQHAEYARALWLLGHAYEGLRRYTEAGRDIHGKAAGSVLTVEFELDGQTFTALNGGLHFKINEAVSFQVMCEGQAEVDYFWQKLSDGGQEGQCGWLKDKFGVSWQVVPQVLPQMLTDADSAKRERAMSALMGMKKFDVEALQRAFAGNA